MQILSFKWSSHGEIFDFCEFRPTSLFVQNFYQRIELKVSRGLGPPKCLCLISKSSQSVLWMLRYKRLIQTFFVSYRRNDCLFVSWGWIVDGISVVWGLGCWRSCKSPMLSSRYTSPLRDPSSLSPSQIQNEAFTRPCRCLFRCFGSNECFRKMILWRTAEWWAYKWRGSPEYWWGKSVLATLLLSRKIPNFDVYPCRFSENSIEWDHVPVYHSWLFACILIIERVECQKRVVWEVEKCKTITRS